jgi:hypothetical protein
MVRLVSVLLMTGSLGGCASGPECDWGQLIGACSASLEAKDTRMLVRTPNCSQIEVRVNDKPRTLTSDDGQSYAASSDDAVEVVSCRTFRDRSVSP